MNIADTRTFQLGPYTVVQRPRANDPACPAYTIWRGEQIVGRSYSRPDEACCRWLESHPGRPLYASGSATLRQYVPRLGRPSNAERARRAALLAGLEDT